MTDSEIIALIGQWRDVEEWSQKTLNEAADEGKTAAAWLVPSLLEGHSDLDHVAAQLFIGLVQITMIEGIKLNEVVAMHLEGMKRSQ